MSLISDKARRRVVLHGISFTHDDPLRAGLLDSFGRRLLGAGAQFEGVPMLLPLDMSSSIPESAVALGRSA